MSFQFLFFLITCKAYFDFWMACGTSYNMFAIIFVLSIILLNSYDLLDKGIAYVKDEGSNLNMLTNALKLIISCSPFLLPTPFAGLCFAMQCERQFSMGVIIIEGAKNDVR